jgi:hypothetical protein
MKINEKIKKCVAFLLYKNRDDYKYAGTCFFIGKDKEVNKYSYVVTAKHVIEGVKSLGSSEVFIKINLIDSTTVLIATKTNSWIYHDDESVDVALNTFYLSDNCDHLFYPESSFLNAALIKQNEIDCGDEVFITGLFKHHHGEERNLPIVRIGNIAMMQGEKVRVKSGLIDAYLIESRSIGGLSGSPVFVNLGVVRKLENQIRHATGEMTPPLLGLVYGHFDSKVGEIDSVPDNKSGEGKINVGIAIVTPVTKLAELLESVKVKQLDKQVDQLREESKAQR